MAYPQFVQRWAERVYQSAAKPDLAELAGIGSSVFDRWKATRYNPDDLTRKRGKHIYDEMRKDDQIKAALKLKKGAAISTGWEITPASDNPKDVEAKDFVDWNLRNMRPLYGSFDDHLEEILVALDFGYSITELIFEISDDGPFRGKFKLATLKSKRPFNFDFDVDEFDNLKEDGLILHDKRLPVDKFLIFSYRKEFGNWYGQSDLRETYRSWWIKDNVYRWLAIYLERYGIPISIGKFPPGAQKAMVSEFQTILQNLQSNTSLTHPDTFSIDLREATGRGSDIFIKTIDQLDMAITRSLLVPSLLGVSPQGDVGSYSQARKHFDVFLIVEDDLRRDIAEDVINNQLIPRMVRPNFNVHEFPQFSFLPFSSEDSAKLFDQWLKAVAADVVKPSDDDEIHIRSITDFPERDIPSRIKEKKVETIPDTDVPKIDDEIDKDVDTSKDIDIPAAVKDKIKSEQQRNIFLWHANLGIVTVNEIRKSIGLDPVPDGELRAAEFLAALGIPPPPSLGAPQQSTELALNHIKDLGLVKHFSFSQYDRTRSPTKFERKTDFARIERGLNELEEETKTRAQEIIEKMRESMIATVGKRIDGGDLTPSFVRNLDLRFKRDLAGVFRQFVTEGYRIGGREAKSMVPKTMQTRVISGIPPEKAIQFFENKADFLISGVKNRLLDQSKNILLNHIKTGQSSGDTVQELRQVFEPYLGDPTSLDPTKLTQAEPFRLETILRTNATEAFTEGLKDGVDQEVADGFVIGFQYAAIIDGRQTEVCAFLDGKIFRPDAEAIALLTPPNHFNCRSTLIPVTNDEGPVKFITLSEIGRGMDLKAQGF